MPKLGIGIIIFLIVAGYFGYRYMTRGPQEQARYEAAVDAAMEREIAQAGLFFLKDEKTQHPNDWLAYLGSLYENPSFAQILNTNFGMLNANWDRNYPRVLRAAHVRNWPADPGRLQAEVDERFGEGTYALMAQKSAEWRAAAPERQRQAEEARQRAQAEADRQMRDIEAYYRRYGHMPGEFGADQGDARRTQQTPGRTERLPAPEGAPKP